MAITQLSNLLQHTPIHELLHSMFGGNSNSIGNGNGNGHGNGNDGISF